ncbi:hypothetical protein P280DRAFT_468870 [Massarina eburnea CBS 473.64]|uniref:BTB domain-containing protein n=1 Tax=Massarina eburnea CBS 473.64 TaxID=1395130 RepID=A0A6A6S457_9PLEO|nr:hypothetical protein P280DRAFT_468870 [Massarina eburnea CBS 473.64]
MADKKHFLKDLGTSTVAIVVSEGSEARTFVVHEKLICERSEFFRVGLDGRWKESEDREVQLPEEDPSTFALYVQALYAGHIAESEPEESLPTKYTMMGNLFALAQKMVDTGTQNVIIKAIHDRVRAELWPEGKLACDDLIKMIDTMWEVLPEDSPVREFLISIFTAYKMNLWYYQDECPELEQLLEHLPSDYLARLSVSLIRQHRRHEAEKGIMALDDFLLP